MMHDKVFSFSVLKDSLAAGAAQNDLVTDAVAGGENGDSFLFSFGNRLQERPSAQKTYLVARDAQLIVGMVILVMDAAVTLPGVAQIAGIITKTAYRRNGIASQLLQHAGSMAAENGKPILTLKTAVSGHPALFFIKAGFAVNGIEPTFSSLADERIVDTIVYWKRFVE